MVDRIDETGVTVKPNIKNIIMRRKCQVGTLISDERDKTVTAGICFLVAIADISKITHAVGIVSNSWIKLKNKGWIHMALLFK